MQAGNMKELRANDSGIKEKITLDSPMMQEFADVDNIQYKQSASAPDLRSTPIQPLLPRVFQVSGACSGSRNIAAAESPLPTLQLRPLQIPSTSSIHIPR